MKRKANGNSTKIGSKDNSAPLEIKKEKKDAQETNEVSLLPCDKLCPKHGEVHIYCEESSGEPYACVLNQTNIAQNNNKFFVIQVLKKFDEEHYYAWIRWGRVGYHGQTALTDCGNDAQRAISIFAKKFSDKTRNDWSERHDFVKVSGKYDLVGTDLGNDDDDEDGEDLVDVGVNAEIKKEENEPSKSDNTKINGKSKSKGKSNSSTKSIPGISSNPIAEPVECKLEMAVQDLIRMICDVRTMEQAARDIEFDTKKTPLGKISTDQIKLGYASLSQIADILKQSNVVSVSKSRKIPTNNRRRLTELSSEFYTRIPHCTGMRAPPIIDNDDLLEMKIQMLEVLGDIKLGMDLLRESSKGGTKENIEEKKVRLHPIDRLYQNLRCDIRSLSCESDEFSLLEQYIMSTHASTHSGYSMEVQELYHCNKDEFLPHYKGEEIGNKVLLFHGSRLSNWAGILSQGLRIAPPEAPVTGYMFGKGVYFADMSSKSANYCFANRSNPYGLLLLCEVALGTPNQLYDADYKAGKLPKGKHSVKGCGRVASQEENFETLEDGTVVPLGPANDVNTNKTSSLNYNEYIVYDTKQIRLRYIAKIKFNYK